VLGLVPDVVALAVNVGWAAYDLLSLSVVVRALRYRGPDADLPQPFADDLLEGGEG
jgi:hypothetical protein